MNSKLKLSYPLPLSDAQKVFYWVPSMRKITSVDSYRYKGEMEVDRLLAAVKTVVNTHDVLRCAFRMSWFRVRQAPVDVSSMDISILTSETYGHRLPELKTQDDHEIRINFLRELAAKLHFSVKKPPLFQLYIYTDIPGETVLMMAAHHIIYDIGSHTVFFKDLIEVYEKGNLSRQVVQYPIYCQTQRSKYIENDTYRKNFRWHTSRAESNMAWARLLPDDHGRKHVNGGEGEAIVYSLGESLSLGVRSVCEKNNVSPHIIILAALSLLSKIKTGKEHLVIASLFSNRVTPESEEIVGCLVKSVYVYISALDDLTIDDFLKSINKTYILGCMHSVLSTSQLGSILRKIERNPNKEGMMVSYEPEFHLLHQQYRERIYFRLERLLPALDVRVGGSIENEIIVCLMYDVNLYGREFIDKSIKDLEGIINAMCLDSSRTIRDLLDQVRS